MKKRYRISIIFISISLVCLVLFLVLNKNELDRTNGEKSVVNIEKQINDSLKKEINKTAIKSKSTPEFPDRLNFASSLEGTEIDGSLAADENGNLILNVDVRDFFDYFLGASDEVGPENAIDEIVRYAREYLPEPADQQAIELLKNYLRYKKTELKLQNVPINQARLTQENTFDLLDENFSALKERRQQLFSNTEDQALFSLEDSYADFTLASLKIRNDKNLNKEQKEQQLAQLQQTLPGEFASSEANQLKAQDLQKETTSLINSDIDDSQLHEELVEQGYSYQKAQEIISYRQKKAYFETQYLAYKEAKKSTKNSSISADQLRKRFFISPEEQTKAALRDLSNK